MTQKTRSCCFVPSAPPLRFGLQEPVHENGPKLLMDPASQKVRLNLALTNIVYCEFLASIPCGQTQHRKQSDHRAIQITRNPNQSIGTLLAHSSLHVASVPELMLFKDFQGRPPAGKANVL